jgi:hypothetical protein
VVVEEGVIMRWWCRGQCRIGRSIIYLLKTLKRRTEERQKNININKDIDLMI